MKAFVFCCLVASAGWAIAAEPEVVLENLDQPCGVAVQPGSGTVFVAEAGKAQVVRVESGQAKPAVIGFGKGRLGEALSFDLSPLGLAFLNQNLLVVGTGDRPAAEDELAVFSLPTPATAPLENQAAVARLRLTSKEAAQGGGNFHGVTCGPRAVFAASQGTESAGWLIRAVAQGTQLIACERFVAAGSLVGVGNPLALTISPRGEVVVALIGAAESSKDSVIAFFGAADRRLLLRLAIELYDVSGLCYGADGQLYATDLAWKHPEQGGLFQLVAVLKDGQQALEARRVLTLQRPTALAAAPDGALYITTLGSKTGQLLKFTLPRKPQEPVKKPLRVSATPGGQEASGRR